MSKVSPDQMVERAMVHRTKYVDASPSQDGGRLLPNERAQLTRTQVGWSSAALRLRPEPTAPCATATDLPSF
jgi:hypothetical protein